MRKDEIIQLHMFLLQLRAQLAYMMEKESSQAFLPYDEMNIFPQQVHRSKDEHKLAIFELSKGIAKLLQENGYSTFQQIHDSLERTCNQLKSKQSYLSFLPSHSDIS